MQDVPVTWITSPGGSGKTTLVADYLAEKKLPCLWYQIDERDGDIASFFYYMSLASKAASPRYKKDLPLLTPEYLHGLPAFTKTYFEELFRRLSSGKQKQATLVFDNFQDAPTDFGFHDIMSYLLEIVPDSIKIFIISRVSPSPQFARLKANRSINFLQ
jgi:ATP/maltotriose-dependent transcriptional regulator MalT